MLVEGIDYCGVTGCQDASDRRRQEAEEQQRREADVRSDMNKSGIVRRIHMHPLFLMDSGTLRARAH